jgi:3-oxoacyl-[acyl-carrier protein] reductase
MSGEHNPGAEIVDNSPLISNSLLGQTAIVSGGSRGIGFAISKGLIALGAQVIIISKNQVNLDNAINLLNQSGANATGFKADVSNHEEISKISIEILNQYSPTILVNSAGVMSEKTAKTLKTSSEEWDRVLDINLKGTFNTIKFFAPLMVEKRQGRIINLTACLGRMSGPGTSGGLAPYRISKAGVNALTKNFAAETGNGKRGIYIDAVCPGHCQTDMGGIDAPRTAEQGAETVLWLASRNTNDQTLTGLLWEDRSIVPW